MLAVLALDRMSIVRHLTIVSSSSGKRHDQLTSNPS